MPQEFPRRHVARWKIPTRTLQDVSDIDGLEPRTELLSLPCGDTMLDVLFEPRGGRTTVVFFHAALATTIEHLPYIGGRTLTDGTKANRIFIGDPTLYRDPSLTLAWYSGNSSVDLEPLILDVIARLHRVAGGRRIMLFGPSGGGFAALRYGHALPASLAVAVNPQTNIAAYTRAHVERYARIGFEAGPHEADRAVTRAGGDLVERYRTGGHQVLYVQNRTDSHRATHMEPFLQAPAHPGRIWTIEGDWGEGHVAPPADDLRALLVRLVRSRGPWREVLPRLAVRREGLLRRPRDPSGLDIRPASWWRP